MSGKENKKEEIEKAFRIYCRDCGCEYIESISWVENDGITECPNCEHKLKIY